MFRTLVASLNSLSLASSITPEDLMKLHPLELTTLMEWFWNLSRAITPASTLGLPDHRSDLEGLDNNLLTAALNPVWRKLGVPATTALPSFTPVPRWDHLIYSYMIENTRIYEIFRRVLHEYLHGEKLGSPTPLVQQWLRTTEQLFYRHPPPVFIPSIYSDIRPDLRASRRNAYWRMFGMDLNHGTDDNAPYPYVKSNAANNEFVSTFEELLREVWIGYVNRSSTTANPTDNAKIDELANKLRDMLSTRRNHGNLSREEFAAVAMMSWFHLTLAGGTQIITELRIDGTSPEQRLFSLAQLVGLPAHGLSRSYFEIAEPISEVLTMIESGPVPANTFYNNPTGTNTLPDTMNKINTHWSLITGRDMKAGKVAAA